MMGMSLLFLVLFSYDLRHVDFQVDYIDVMLLHATDCEEEGGRLSCVDADKSSTRTWEDAWQELETTVDEGECSGRTVKISQFIKLHGY